MDVLPDRASRRANGGPSGIRILQGILVLLAVTVSATAAEVQADLRVDGSVAFQGADLQINALGAVFDEALGSKGTPEGFHLADARVRVLSYTHTFVRAGSERVQVGDPEGGEQVVSDSFTGDVRFVPTDDPGSVRILPLGPQPLGIATAGAGSIGTTVNLARADTGLSSFPAEAEGLRMRPFGWGGPLSIENGTLSLDAPVRIVVHGFEVVLDGDHSRSITTGTSRNETGTVLLPDGQGVERIDDRVAILEGSILWSPDADLPSWRVIVDEATGYLDGDIVLNDPKGRLEADGQEQGIDPQILQLIGTLRIDAEYGQEGGAWVMTGDATFLALDTQPTIQEGALWAAGGVAAVGLLGFLTRWGREALSLILGRNVADPLGNPTRLDLLRSISERPGITRMELARGAGVARGTVLHHLRILERADLVQSFHQAEQPAYALNSGSLKFRIQAAGGEVPVADLLARLNHPVRLGMVRVLKAQGESTYDDLVSGWPDPDDAPAPDKVSYHGRALEAAGVVSRRRDGMRVWWRLEADPDDIRSHQRRSLLVIKGLLPVVEALQAGPTDPDGLRRQLKGKVSRSRLTALPEKLRLLEAIGMVRKLGNGTYVVSEPLASASGHPMAG